jgi:ABC-type transport system involved in multi-copper enzyme maturation permease subunit
MASVWAIALNTIKQAVRLKIAVVFILLLVVMLTVMGLATTGDGTIKGRLQTFVSYGMSLTSLLLCLLTIIVSIYTLTSDIKNNQICTVVTKPVRRFQILLGKLLGVVVLDLVLLVIFSSVIYAITILTPGYLKASEDELTGLKNEFFTARASLTPEKIDVSKEVEQTFKELVRSRQIDSEVLENRSEVAKIKAEIADAKQKAARSAAPGEQLVWEFNNVKIKSGEPNAAFFIRFKYEVVRNPADMMIYSRWKVGDYRAFKLGIKPDTPEFAIDRKDKIRTFHEIEVPAGTITKDEYMAVAFLNYPRYNDTPVIFPADGLEVLYKADSFQANYLRAVIIIFLRLFFLACLGLFAGSFLSLPTAMLLCFIVYITGSISGFINESFSALSPGVDVIYNYTIKIIIHLLPSFDTFNPTKFLVGARLISWELVGRIILFMGLLQSMVFLAAAIVIFSRREIAKIIV